MSGNDTDLLTHWTTTGNPDAFSALVQRYAPLVFSAAARVLGNPTEAEDVTQECFLELAQRPPAIKTTLAGWLHRLATHRALNHARGENRRRDREQAYAEAQERSLVTTESWDDISAHIDEAVDGLKPGVREAIILRFYRGMSPEEIAKTLRIAPRTVRHRQQQGIEAIRGALRKRGILVAAGFLALLERNLAARASVVPESLNTQLGKLALSGIRPQVAVTGAFPTLAKLVLGSAGMLALLVAGLALVWSGEDAPEAAPSGPAPSTPQVASAEPLPTSSPSPLPASAPNVAVPVTIPAITFTLTDADGAPIAHSEAYDGHTEHLLGEGDDGGEIAIPEVPEETNVIKIASSGFDEAYVYTLPRLQHGPIDARLSPRSLPDEEIRVLDESGRPLAGVRIVQEASASARVVATTDQEGVAVLPNALDAHRLYLAHETLGIQLLDGDGHDGFRSVAYMRPPRTLVVKTVSDGVPVAGVEVSLSEDGFDGESLTTDTLGEATFDGLYTERDLLVTARLDQEDGHPLIGDALVTFGSSGTVVQTVSLRPAPSIVSGSVRWKDGTPCTECTVKAFPENYPRRSFEVNVSGQGAYRLPLFPDYNVLHVENLPKPGGLSERVTLYGSSFTPTLTQELVLHPADVPSAKEAEAAPETEFKLDFPGKELPQRVTILDTRSGSTVYGALDMPPDGILRMKPMLPDSSVLAVVSKELEVGGIWRRPEVVESSRITLSMDMTMTAIEGTVRDHRGNPVPHARVSAHIREWVSILGQADRDGRYRLWPVPEGGAVWFNAEAPGHFPLRERITVRNGVVPFSPRLARPDTPVQGRVYYADGTAVPRGSVYCENRGDNPDHTLLVSQGRFSGMLVPGEWRLYASDGHLRGDKIDVQVPSGEIVLTIDEVPMTDVAQGTLPDQEVDNMLKLMGLVLKMFANESEEEVFPPPSKVYGRFTPDTPKIYPEYLSDSIFLERLAGSGLEKFCYLGFAVENEAAGMAYLDAYETLGPEAVLDKEIPYEVDRDGETVSASVVRLHERYSSGRNQAEIPVLWQVPDPETDRYGWVLFMDGHTEQRAYPGEFPMTEAFVGRIRELQAAAD